MSNKTINVVFQASNTNRAVQRFMNISVPEGKTFVIEVLRAMSCEVDKALGESWMFDNVTFLDEDLRQLSRIDFRTLTSVCNPM